MVLSYRFSFLCAEAYMEVSRYTAYVPHSEQGRNLPCSINNFTEYGEDLE